jgi:hypothetical protein
MRIGLCILLLWGGQTALSGQTLGQALDWLNPFSTQPGGWRLYSLSSSATYYSVGLPYGYASIPAGAPLEPAGGASAGGAMGWTHLRDVSSEAVSYTASYGTQSGYTGFRALNESLSGDWERKLRGRWRLSVLANAAVDTRDQYEFGAPAPVTIGSTQAGLESGNPAAEPLGRVLFGNRVFIAQMTNKLTYQQSQRVTWNFILYGLRVQGLPDPQGGETGSLLTASTSVSIDAQMRYHLSPRTTLNFVLEEMRTVSRIEDIYVTRATAGISHSFSRRWQAEIYGGGSGISPLREMYEPNSLAGSIAGGSVEYQAYRHTFVASASRQLGDAYGLGAANSLRGKALWKWRWPGNAWWFQAELDWQKLSEGTNFEDWWATGTINRTLSPHFSAQVAYVYWQFSQTHPGLPPSQSSARAGVTWYPRENHR